MTIDCDKDTLLAKVEQIGPACHTGSPTCFFQTIAGTDYDETNPLEIFQSVYDTILDRKKHPKEGSYTNYLFDKGIDKILKKVGEEMCIRDRVRTALLDSRMKKPLSVHGALMKGARIAGKLVPEEILFSAMDKWIR